MTGRPARALLCRAALVLLAITAAWALLVVATGGFVIHVGALRVSARRALNPGIAVLASAAAAWALATSAERRRALAAAWAVSRGERGPLRLLKAPDTLARFIAFTVVVAVVVLGLLRGSFVAAGADAYGYASQADLWASGRLIVEQPFARDMTWPHAAETLSPLGYRPYRPAPHGTDIVPVYSPGLPMVMAAFKLVAGPNAIFVVVPLLAGLAVWATYLLGSRVGSPLVGAAGAVLLASSPSFMAELVSVSSDVPVTAWWALALALLMSDRRPAVFGAGLATGLAILTRPNLILLAAVPGGFLLWRALRERMVAAHGSGLLAPLASGHHAARALLFAAGSIPGCLAVAGINWHLYGSPLVSGYGALDSIYSWSHLSANLARYPRWLFESQTAVVALALIAPFVPPRRSPWAGKESPPYGIWGVWLCFIGVVLLSYLFYQPFEEWSYVRFLLPAYPPLLVMTSTGLATVFSALDRLARGLRGVATAAAAALVAWHGVDYSADAGTFVGWKTEQRYVKVGSYVATTPPDNAALFSMQHSGSARYYSGRLTVRYDLLPERQLDPAVDELGRLGYHPYFLLEDWEIPLFRQRFQGFSALGEINWMPQAIIHANRVRIYDPADRVTGLPDRVRVPDVVP